MNITVQYVTLVISASTSIATVIFLGAFYLGRLHGRLERAEVTLGDHGKRLDKHDDMFREFQG